MVPKERAEDVVYFNPADTQYPLGLNLFEFTDPSQKDFLVQETINMLYKLYDPGHTGIIGPRYEHWYRNAALTLMADPNGATFIEIPKVFTDTEYLEDEVQAPERPDGDRFLDQGDGADERLPQERDAGVVREQVWRLPEQRDDAQHHWADEERV
jgi:hypothetical protein